MNDLPPDTDRSELLDQKSRFWDRKILKWESDKYRAGLPLLDVNASVKFRRDLALRMLLPLVKGRTVLEVGCGSALLAPALLEGGAKKYVGMDFSAVAVEAARSRLAGDGRAELILRDWTSGEALEADVCFSLGVLDWLAPPQIRQAQRNVRCRHFLHSFSELRLTPQILLHRIYVFAMYGHKDAGYVPRYYSQETIRESLDPDGALRVEFLRHEKLRFSCFAHNLPPPSP
jgi:SAM-dependent methyltransferase